MISGEEEGGGRREEARERECAWSGVCECECECEREREKERIFLPSDEYLSPGLKKKRMHGWRFVCVCVCVCECVCVCVERERLSMKG